MRGLVLVLAGAALIVYAALQGYRSQEEFLECDERECVLVARSFFGAAQGVRLRTWVRGDVDAVRVERKLARGRGTIVAQLSRLLIVERGSGATVPASPAFVQGWIQQHDRAAAAFAAGRAFSVSCGGKMWPVVSTRVRRRTARRWLTLAYHSSAQRRWQHSAC